MECSFIYIKEHPISFEKKKLHCDVIINYSQLYISPLLRQRFLIHFYSLSHHGCHTAIKVINNHFVCTLIKRQESDIFRN